jgi:hypothetical protein
MLMALNSHFGVRWLATALTWRFVNRYQRTVSYIKKLMPFLGNINSPKC